MPGRRGLCGCLPGRRAPPQISYGVENGGLTLKPIEMPLPRPEEEELNARFEELVDELGLDKAHREAMFNLDPEKKWQIYCSQKKFSRKTRYQMINNEYDPYALCISAQYCCRTAAIVALSFSSTWLIQNKDRDNYIKEQDEKSYTSNPEYYIEKLNSMSSICFGFDAEEIETRTKQVDSLKTALRTQPMSFVLRFLELEGLNCLLNFLQKMDHTTQQSSIHTSLIGCVKNLMNSSQGRAHVLAHPNSINIIAQSLRTQNRRTKVVVLEFLGACCLVPGGHRKVLQAMLHYQRYACERTRFQTLMLDLDEDSGDYKEDIAMKTAIMSFINAALNYGPGQHHLEFRLHLRYEFLMLGIIPIFEKLRNYDNATLDRHIDFFEHVRNQDEKEIAKRFECSHIDTRSASAMFELVKKKLNFSTSYSSLLSILFHFLQMPFGNGQGTLQWDLVDKIIQQIVLQTKDGDPDMSPLDVDVKKIVKQLANENAIKEIQTKMREIQKENDDLTSNLAKKERECEIKLEETEELLETLNKIKTKLEKETASHLEAKQHVNELSAKFTEITQVLEVERVERLKLENAVKTGSLPDDAKMGVANLNAELAAAKLILSAAQAPPPPPPPMAGAPPPPPPPPPGCPVPPPPPGSGPAQGGGGFSLGGLMAKKKDVPKPSQPLKSFNWSKLSDNKIKGTVWKDVEDEKLYKHLDLGDFEYNFSAYQKQEDTDSLNRSMDKSNKVKDASDFKLSVIDGRRAQNCTILLSKLKMTNQELAKAILNVDSREDIPKDMCEQLLKFIPTPEEVQLLEEHSHEIEEMAKADRFLFEMSRIDHYEERLNALYFKKKFSERMNDAKPKVEIALLACNELINSHKLRKLLEIVLAYGNYMNRGQRGNAFGFRMSSLNKMVDTKSSINRRVTLLHYIITVMEKQYPKLLDLEKELPHLRKAAKINLGDLEAEINQLRSGLRAIEKELQYRRRSTTVSVPNDKFVTVMSGFVSVATYNFQELEEQLEEAKERFDKATKLYCEESRPSEADEFFAIFENFLASFSTCRIENDRFVREKEQEEKRLKQETLNKVEREKRANRINVNGQAKTNGHGQKEGEFDDLISALRTGDVFGEDIAKLKRVRKKSNGVLSKGGDSRERVISVKAN